MKAVSTGLMQTALLRPEAPICSEVAFAGARFWICRLALRWDCKCVAGQERSAIDASSDPYLATLNGLCGVARAAHVWAKDIALAQAA